MNKRPQCPRVWPLGHDPYIACELVKNADGRAIANGRLRFGWVPRWLVRRLPSYLLEAHRLMRSQYYRLCDRYTRL